MYNSVDEILNNYIDEMKKLAAEFDEFDWEEKTRTMRIPTQEEMYPESKPEPEPESVTMSGESEWMPPGTSDEVKQEDDSTERSMDEIMKIVHTDPIHAVSNLMIQRKPEYQTQEILLPLAQALVNWVEEANIAQKAFQKGTMLYDELSFILDLLEKAADKSEDKPKDHPKI